MKRRTILKPTNAPYWVYERQTGWARFKLVMTSRAFRKYFGINHPAIILWKALMVPVLVAALVLAAIAVALANGPSEARAFINENF
jgi:hypothetical protein